MRRFVAACLVCAALGGGAAQAQERQLNAFAQRQLDELKREPSIREVQEAALRRYNLDTDTINSMRTRAGLKSLLPSVGARARFGNSDVNLDSFDFVTFPDQVAARDLATGTNLEIEVSGAWDLSRLVFNPEVLDVSALVTLQEGVIKEVTRLYYARRRLQIDLILNPPADAAEQLSRELRIEELTASLDAATGSLFSRQGQE